MNPNLQRLLPSLIAGGLGACFLLAAMMLPGDPSDKMQLHEAGKLPAQQGGRVMPLDTVARNSLMLISGRQEFEDRTGKKENERGVTQSAVKWLFDVMVSQAGDGPGFDHRVFRIENDQVLGLLRLTPRSGFRYSFNEIGPRFKEFVVEYDRVRRMPADKKGVYENKVFELGQHIHVFDELADRTVPFAIPPVSGEEKWRSVSGAIPREKGVRADAATEAFMSLLVAYRDGDAKGFNSSLAAYQKLLDKQIPAEADRTGFENFYNNFAPFYQCMILYVCVMLLACASWITFPKEFIQAALTLTVLCLVVHTFALIGRMYLMDRPLVFVTNLYSSAVFIGWVCVVLSLVLEWIYQNGLGCFVAGVGGFATLIIGHHLAATGDTLGMMEAVLDTNFWLATHVTCVTIGYSATFVAGILGIVMICRGVFTTSLSKDDFKTLGRMIYGIVCFAMLFSFVGTVLGGLWADYSWGRFWGWDPKENGALLIVIWNALILHARWGGIVQQRGMAVLAVAGNIITSWSWFGVNMLGIGLHSYGFMESALPWLLGFVGSQLVVIGVGMVPLRLWPSFAAKAAAPAPTATPAPTAVLPPAPATAIKAAAGTRKSKHIKAQSR